METPGPEIQVDLEIPAIPYQVEHVRRMSSDDEEIICDVTRNEVIEYTVVGKYRLIYRIDSTLCPVCFSFLKIRRKHGRQYSQLTRCGEYSDSNAR